MMPSSPLRCVTEQCKELLKELQEVVQWCFALVGPMVARGVPKFLGNTEWLSESWHRGCNPSDGGPKEGRRKTFSKKDPIFRTFTVNVCATVGGSQKSHSQPPVWMVLKPVVNHGINYQPQLVQDFSYQFLAQKTHSSCGAAKGIHHLSSWICQSFPFPNSSFWSTLRWQALRASFPPEELLLRLHRAESGFLSVKGLGFWSPFFGYTPEIKHNIDTNKTPHFLREFPFQARIFWFYVNLRGVCTLDELL